MKIKDICTSVTDGSHNPPQGIEKSEYMMLSSKNVFDDEITFDEPRFLSEKDFEREYTRTKVAVGDVLLTIVGTVGRAATVDEDMPAFTLQRSVAVLHPKSDVCLPRFLMYALRRKRTYIENRANALKGISGSASPHINVGDIKAFRMIMPPIELQNQFADFVHQVTKSKVAVQKALDETQLLFDSLMQQYFG